ncbi:MAG: diaminopimelate epimerase [Bacteroidota bacterium]|nr:diaminopimelate epimerase [Bacteroidota bacterium]
MIDNRHAQFVFNTTEAIAQLCHRRFGIGADGLILLEVSSSHDFKMVYYNSDGNEGSMCGNGGRCIVAFAQFLGIAGDKTTFEAIDGVHEASRTVTDQPLIALKMKDVHEFTKVNGSVVLDTGSPHYVTFCDDINTIDIITEGRKIRNSELYKATGINVNFIAKNDTGFIIKTYERGVEDETYSCGTGTVAAAIALVSEGRASDALPVKFHSAGGSLEVSFIRNGNHFTNIVLTGPATQVFEGFFEIE